ncbi:MAG: peroxidase-related enzyme [Flavobacteriales bacterium]|nr:peroxidase-related enzyme [Flavobacteriales bacterium]
MAYIDVIDYNESEGRLKEIYDDLIDKRGKLAAVHKIQSLNPETIVNHMDLYLTVMFGKSPLKRYQREMIAVVVSCANNCNYCQEHHAAAVLHYWKDKEMVTQLRKDYRELELAEVDRALCDFAWDMTKNPNDKKEFHSIRLKALGLEDRAILDGVLVISYFNFVNRMILGLGVHLETDGGEGYNY